MNQITQLMGRRGVRQFIKFIIIGFSSALIDITISSVLIYKFHLRIEIAKTISFTVAVTNGFIWNSLWTFKGMGSGRRHEMYVKFFAVNIVGFLLNMGATMSSLFLLTGRMNYTSNDKPPFLIYLAATVVAIICASIWNFLANKFWTFRHKTAEVQPQ